MKKSKVMGFPIGVGEDIGFLGKSYIKSDDTTQIPQTIVKKYGLEKGDIVLWQLKGDVLFIRFQIEDVQQENH